MPVIVEPRYDIAEMAPDLARVYADFPGNNADTCLATIRDALTGDGVFYAGIFNGKPVGGALVTGPADARRIRLIAVRAATRGRGVSLRLIDEIGRLEYMTGARALEVQAGESAAAVLARLGFAAVRDGLLRKALPATPP
jgi:GNAT superfamily N-acetyltransferase